MAKKKDDVAAEVKQYKVLSHLTHDGEAYAPGESVSLTADQAKDLLPIKVVAPAEETAPAEQ